MIYPTYLSNTKIPTLSTTSLTSCQRVLHSASLQDLRPAFQNRALWMFTHEKRKHDRYRTETDKHQHFCQSVQRLRPGDHHRRPGRVYHEFHPWKTPNLSWGGWKTNFTEIPNPKTGWRGPWEARRIRARHRLEWIKKEIDADPYKALFGRRLEPFGWRINPSWPFISMCRFFLGLDKDPNPAGATKVKTHHYNPVNIQEQKSKVQEAKSQSVQNSKEPEFKFDPISGRMVSTSSKPVDVTKELHTKDINPKQPRDEMLESLPKEEGYVAPVGGPVAASLGSNLIGGEEDIPISTSASKPVTEKNEDVSSTTITSLDNPPILPEFAPETTNGLPSATENLSKTTHVRPQFCGKDGVPAEIVTNDSGVNEHKLSENSENYDNFPTILKNHDETSLDRMGFLPRDDPRRTCTTQEQKLSVKESEEAELDALLASDIRASYASKNLNQESEMQQKLTQNSGNSIDSHTSPPDFHKQTKESHLSSNISTFPSITDKELELPMSEHQQQQENQNPYFLGDLPYKTPTEMYRVLAYDPSSQQITQAEITSSFHSPNETFHPAEILPRLDSPAKFLPYFEGMQAEGYEIVSGGRDILVFRKTLRPDGHQAYMGPEHDKIGDQDARAALSAKPQLDNSNVGGSLNTQYTNESFSNAYTSSSEDDPKLKKVLRRMILTGVATAATCYAIGVVIEYFRTGGREGLGIDGFTEFESERRHRELD